MTEADVYTERIDDVPLLVRQQEAMTVPQVLDEAIIPHGNWQGLSVGWVTTGWLTYILSEADHRMCEVEEWARDLRRSGFQGRRVHVERSQGACLRLAQDDARH